MPDKSKVIEIYCQNLKSMPMSISILGELMMIATKRDFSLITKENHKFEILKHPESFRASVVQVFIMGYKAFQNALSRKDGKSITFIALQYSRFLAF